MKAPSLVLTATLFIPVSAGAATLPSPSPVLNGIGLYQLQHARGSASGLRNADEDLTKRAAAIEQCAGSVAEPISQAYGSSDRLRLEIIGSKYRNNGDLRIFGAASVRQPRRTVEFSCDIDMHGNLRRVDLGRLTT